MITGDINAMALAALINDLYVEAVQLRKERDEVVKKYNELQEKVKELESRGANDSDSD